MHARYILIGGFLGAGKTTAILAIAQKLSGKGRRVGLITNDQSMGLVDTALLSRRGQSTAEVTGGCFCCKFNSLVEASEQLSQQNRPDVFIAEPVGSCTDLKATVSYPLRRLYGDTYRVAPLCVLVDPVRVARVLGLETGKVFSSKVQYIYRKQLEEAEAIIINKCDLLEDQQVSRLEDAIRRAFPAKKVLRISARKGSGLDEWLDFLMAGELGAGGAMEVDYDTYAEGEALLGWLNATVRLKSDADFDGNAYVQAVGEAIRAALEAEGAEPAHLKMTLMPEGVGRDLAVANLVRSGQPLELPYRLCEPLTRGTLLVNLRAEADPATLRGIVEQQFRSSGGIDCTIEDLAAFRPGRPVPTHRMAEA